MISLFGGANSVNIGTAHAHMASYLALHSSLFGPVVQLVMIILSLTAFNVLLTGSRCFPNGAHTNHC